MVFSLSRRLGAGLLGAVLTLGTISPGLGHAQPADEPTLPAPDEDDADAQAQPAEDEQEALGTPEVEAETEKARQQEAVELYEQGRAAYREGRYEEAIGLLKAAHERDPESPTLIFNVAKVNELLGNLDEAIDYYERYLEALPAGDSEERRTTQETLRRLRGAKETHGARPQPTAPNSQASTPTAEGPEGPEMGRADTLFWLTGGAGAVLVLGGAVVGALALEKQSTADNFVLGRDGSATEWRTTRDRADQLALGADVLLVAGAAALGGAALLYFLREAEDQPIADVALIPSLGGAQLIGHF